MKKHFQTLILLFCISAANGQLLHPDKTELFRDDIVPRVDILIEQSSLDYILDPSNEDSDELFPATFIYSTDEVSDTLPDIGFRLRGNTSRGADKKSFKIDLNTFVSGRRYYGVEEINLNGQHNDPTSSRAKISADIAESLDIPSMRTNHVVLYINGEYRGLYSNVEHIDQRYVKHRFGNQNGNLYKCLYPADLDYKGDNPDAYKELVFGRRNYDLKTNKEIDDYTDFAEFIKILNLTSISNLSCELENVFNVDQYLRTIVFDILIGNWDGPIYNQNNFYLYHNEDTDLFEYIPFDLDNTLGIDWLNRDWGNRDIYSWSQSNNYRPIYTRIMSVPEYKNRFSFYMQKALTEVFNEGLMYPYLDALRNKLIPYIENDTYYTLDYGFDTDDFEDGFEIELPFFQTDYGIKEFIQTRVISAYQQLEINSIAPVVTNVIHNYPSANESLRISAKVIDDIVIHNIKICYNTADGAMVCADMLDDGNQVDLMAGDQYYSALLPAIGEIGDIQFTIEAMDNDGNIAAYPSCEPKTITIESDEITLSINELMAKNNTTIADIKGQFDDWIEVYNYGSLPIYLGDKYLTDNPDNPDQWQMPNIILAPDEYYLIWTDDDRSQGRNHTNFKLSANQDYLAINEAFEDNYRLIDEVDFENQKEDISYGRLPNGIGDFVKLIPTPSEMNVELSTSIHSLPINKPLVFPNPFDNYIATKFKRSEIARLQLYSMEGRLLKTAFSNKINTINLNSGCYILNIKLVTGQTLSNKIIKI